MLNNSKIIRIQEWWSHILPPILLFYYLGLFNHQDYPVILLLKPAYLMFLAINTALIGYFLNDLFDIEEDKKAGKKNTVAAFPAWLKISFVPALTVLFLLSLRWWNSKNEPLESCFYLCTFSVNVFLFLLYSIKPVRLKNNIWLAPPTDALYSGTLFYLLAFLTGIHLNTLDFNFIFLNKIIYFILLWGFIRGLRNYLTHLADDCTNDKAANVATLATVYGSKNVQLWANLLFPAELILLAVLIALHLENYIPSILLCGVFFIVWLAGMFQSSKVKNQWLNDLHEVWLPLLLLVQLIVQSNSLYPLLVMHLVLFPRYLLKIYHLLDAVYFYTIFKIIGPIRKPKE